MNNKDNKELECPFMVTLLGNIVFHQEFHIKLIQVDYTSSHVKTKKRQKSASHYYFSGSF